MTKHFFLLRYKNKLIKKYDAINATIHNPSASEKVLGSISLIDSELIWAPIQKSAATTKVSLIKSKNNKSC
jgi:Ni,Fe-hydrogenase III large subunit